MNGFKDLPKLYCDMDQVLCDFITSANSVLQDDFTKVNNVIRWKSINDVADFWENLPWMPDGKELHEMIIKYNGKDFAKAAKASEDIFPAKNVSTILNNV